MSSEKDETLFSNPVSKTWNPKENLVFLNETYSHSVHKKKKKAIGLFKMN